MWEHLGHHVLRGDILSSSCCHGWVASGQLKAHFPQEEPAVIPLPRGTFFSLTSLLNADGPEVAIRMAGPSLGSIGMHSYTLGRAGRSPGQGFAWSSGLTFGPSPRKAAFY